MAETFDTNAKALRLNMDASAYGTFAEIGGGQEVSRWFFRVGAAAGTVAKTMSAYDMTVSDAIYGAGSRYVSRERLRAMLTHEFDLLVDRLSPKRGDTTAFFAFADTVATQSFKGGNECHGWIGLRFQHKPGAPPSDILVHVSLRDPTAQLQQQSLGLFGVNLVFGAFYLRDAFDAMLWSLLDGLSIDNLEIDVIDCSGAAFEGHRDQQTLAIDMLAHGLTRAVVFDAEGRMEQPSSVFRKRGLLVHRGSVGRHNPELDGMMSGAEALFKQDTPSAENEPLSVLEISVAGLPAEKWAENVDILARLNEIIRPGNAAIVTNMAENYRLSEFLRRFSTEGVRFVVGLDAIVTMLRETFYKGVDGGLLEGLGRVFAANTKAYVFPMPSGVFREHLAMHGVESNFWTALSKPVVGLDDVTLAPPAGHLLDFLRNAGWVVAAQYPTA